MEPLVELFRALGNSRRLKGFIYLHKNGGAAVCDLAEELGISEQATSFHLKKLARAGIIKQNKVGKFVISSFF